MSRQLPFLAMDGVLCDYSLPLFGGKAKRENKTMPNIMTSQEVESHTKKLVARLLGQDSAMDDETVEKLKGFLKNKLTAEDHEQVCNMLAGDVDAQDTEPPLDDIPAKTLKEQTGISMDSMLAKRAKDRDDFFARFPGAARIRIDNSGIQPQPRGRASSVAMDAAGAKSFFDRYPGLARVRLL